jgi:hypothetical protein
MGCTMKRVFGSVVVLSLVTALAGACDDSSGSGPYYVTPGSGAGYACNAYTTCGSCTAAVGCGWCEDPNGRGLCGWGPDACPSSAFSWTWNPSGCRNPADASVSTVPDAAPASDAGRSDADARSDAASDASGDAASDGATDGETDGSADAPVEGATDDTDSAPSGDGCASNAGALCSASAPFGVTCTTTHPFEASIPTPDPALGCTVLPVPTSVGSAYFCCVTAP